MPRKYDNNFKSMIINLIVNQKHSTLKTAEQFDIPIKTLEKWITAYNKNHYCFDNNNEPNDFHFINDHNPNYIYDDMSNDTFKRQLIKKNIEIAR